jgi:hypothetical protein
MNTNVVSRNYGLILGTLTAMNNDIQEFEQKADEMLRDTQAIVGSGWIGKDAEAASTAIQISSSKLKERASRLLEANSVLKEDIENMMTDELTRANEFSSF